MRLIMGKLISFSSEIEFYQFLIFLEKSFNLANEAIWTF